MVMKRLPVNNRNSVATSLECSAIFYRLGVNTPWITTSKKVAFDRSMITALDFRVDVDGFDSRSDRKIKPSIGISNTK